MPWGTSAFCNLRSYRFRPHRETGICAGTSYIDSGTLGGYRAAMHLLNQREQPYSRSLATEGDDIRAHEFADENCR